MKYQLATYFNEDKYDLGITPGVDQRIEYDDLEKAKCAAALACTLDLHDGAIVWDKETGEVMFKVGEDPNCSIYQ